MIEGFNRYFWKITTHNTPVVNTQPFGADDFEADNFAPISVHNAFPEKLDNVSIFPYLLNENQDEFSIFVKKCYKNSCAIVFAQSGRDPQIIGSGFFFKNNWVITARHLFQDLPEEGRLFVRFFHYKVRRENNHLLLIDEHYIDRRVVRKLYGQFGLDISCLRLFPINDNAIHQKYTRTLPSLSRDFNLSGGIYYMFHFASGIHQISAGEVINESSNTSNLSQNISIQAGLGASGAGIISLSLGNIQGHGISIYREIDGVNGWVERRIITFREIFDPNSASAVYTDPITAPYRKGEDIIIKYSLSSHRSGYEFLRWHRAAQIGNRMAHPKHPTYLEDEQCSHHRKVHCSNHHIVQIDDMIYLWDYLHSLEDDVKAGFLRIAAQEADLYFKNELKKIYRSNYSTFSGFYNNGDRNNSNKHDIKMLKQKTKKRYDERYESLVNEELHKRYGQFYLIINALMFPEDIDSEDGDRTWFAWSWWNLFKGWDREFRTDDPSYHHPTDRSEKIKPLGFNAALWAGLKDNDGLHQSITKLKNTTQRNIQIETLVKNSLFRIQQAVENHVIPREVYPYHPYEWERQGSENRHPVYALRKV